MARPNRLFIIGGVLCAVIAFVGIAIFLGSQGSGSAAQQPATRNVLVALQDIPVGEPVTPEMVEVREVPGDAAAGTPIGDPSALGNRPAVFAVAKGAQVTEETFGRIESGQIDLAGQLGPGEKAVAFQVDRVTGLHFLLEQGDVIDVIVSVEIVSVAQVDEETGETNTVEALGAQRTVKTVLQARRVLFVSDTGMLAPQSPEGEEQPPAAPADQMTIIIAGSDQDAEILKFAQRDMNENGAVTVTLRSPDDDAIEETTGITLDRLIEQYGVPVPNVVILPESTPAP